MTDRELKKYEYNMAIALLGEFLDKLIVERAENRVLRDRIEELEKGLNTEHLENTNQGI